MKEKILLTIYDEYDKWSALIPRVCNKGCSTCCTQNVTITALEGERILDYICHQGMEQWFADRLRTSQPPPPPSLTINEYATNCFQQLETTDRSDTEYYAACPFLESDCCSIYPVRSFGCRCFISKNPCDTEGTAIVPDYYVAASTAMTQIIEHLGQNEYWGNMSDVLLSLCDISKYQAIKRFLPDNSMIIKARLRVKRARTLPGFLLLEEERQKVIPLIESIFSTQVDGRSIRDILNGRGKPPLK